MDINFFKRTSIDNINRIITGDTKINNILHPSIYIELISEHMFDKVLLIDSKGYIFNDNMYKLVVKLMAYEGNLESLKWVVDNKKVSLNDREVYDIGYLSAIHGNQQGVINWLDEIDDTNNRLMTALNNRDLESFKETYISKVKILRKNQGTWLALLHFLEINITGQQLFYIDNDKTKFNNMKKLASEKNIEFMDFICSFIILRYNESLYTICKWFCYNDCEDVLFDLEISKKLSGNRDSTQRFFSDLCINKKRKAVEAFLNNYYNTFRIEGNSVIDLESSFPDLCQNIYFTYQYLGKYPKGRYMDKRQKIISTARKIVNFIEGYNRYNYLRNYLKSLFGYINIIASDGNIYVSKVEGCEDVFDLFTLIYYRDGMENFRKLITTINRCNSLGICKKSKAFIRDKYIDLSYFAFDSILYKVFNEKMYNVTLEVMKRLKDHYLYGDILRLLEASKKENIGNNYYILLLLNAINLLSDTNSMYINIIYRSNTKYFLEVKELYDIDARDFTCETFEILYKYNILEDYKFDANMNAVKTRNRKFKIGPGYVDFLMNKDIDKQVLLSFAFQANYYEVIRELIMSNIDVNIKKMIDDIVSCNDLDVINLLFETGRLKMDSIYLVFTRALELNSLNIVEWSYDYLSDYEFYDTIYQDLLDNPNKFRDNESLDFLINKFMERLKTKDYIKLLESIGHKSPSKFKHHYLYYKFSSPEIMFSKITAKFRVQPDNIKKINDMYISNSRIINNWMYKMYWKPNGIKVRNIVQNLET